MLIVPRVALALQYKRELASIYCPQIFDELQDQGIKKRERFGPVDVFTYHEFVNIQTRQKIEDFEDVYDFLILDEVHAYVGDAGFNPFTEEILTFLICKIGKKCKRLYLTATPEIILEELVEIENKVPERPWPGVDRYGHLKETVNLTMYRFKVDYSYLQPYFFEAEDTVVQHLQSRPSEEKTVIFVRSKAQGIRLQKKLGLEKAVFLNADNKEGDEEEAFHELLEKQSFSQQFLIATRFLDVGVNLKGWNIRHVVIFHIFKEDVLQMLGRKRMARDEAVNLYIRIPRLGELQSEINRIETENEEMQKIVTRYERKYPGFVNELPKPMFLHFTGDDLEVKNNSFSFGLNDYHISQLKEFVDGFEDGLDYYENLISIVLSWFPGHQKAKNLERKAKTICPVTEQFRDLLEPIVGNEMNKEETVKLSNQILQMLKIPCRSDQHEQMAMKKISDAFKERDIPYEIRNLSKEGKTGVWIVVRR